MREIHVIAHNMRSTFNVGSLLRTAEGLGIKKVYLSGYTPYPKKSNDSRLPHIYQKLSDQITKTALGAENMIAWEQYDDIWEVLRLLKEQGIPVAALEQSTSAIRLMDYEVPDKVALLLGEEVDGISGELLDAIDTHLVIPMFGKKESFNVVQAAAMALYQLRFK